MADMDDENDLGRFMEDGKSIRPIEVGKKTPPPVRGEIHKQSIASEALKNTFDNEQNRAQKGDVIDLLRKDPTLRQVTVGAGWEQKAIEESKIDVDLSVFLLDRNGQTRVDEDFVFYNTPSGCDGAVQHLGDSRTGAGDGDDECLFIDLNGVPFDVQRLVFVLSVYDEDLKGKHLGQVRDIFLRIVNKEDGIEIVRFDLEDGIYEGVRAVYAAALVRDGPKWHFEALGHPVTRGGLEQAATAYGIIVKELQSTG